jgi:hypothetical protein
VLLPGLGRHPPGAAARDPHQYHDTHIHSGACHRHCDPERNSDHHRDPDHHPDAVRAAVRHTEHDPYGEPDAQRNLHAFTYLYLHANVDEYVNSDGHAFAHIHGDLGAAERDASNVNLFNYQRQYGV